MRSGRSIRVPAPPSRRRSRAGKPQVSMDLMPGQYRLHEEVVCRRRAAGVAPWNWNVDVAVQMRVPRMPLAATGKIDKIRLRATFGSSGPPCRSAD